MRVRMLPVSVARREAAEYILEWRFQPQGWAGYENARLLCDRALVCSSAERGGELWEQVL